MKFKMCYMESRNGCCFRFPLLSHSKLRTQIQGYSQNLVEFGKAASEI